MLGFIPQTHRGTIRLSILGLAVLAAACGEPASPTVPAVMAEAKGGVKGPGEESGDTGEVTVSEADPSWGHQGDLALEVRISGSGFDETSEAIWERDGQPDLKVITRSTRFVSSTEIVATIDIAGDADVDLYDIAVLVGSGGNRKKGIGIEMFQVTKAESLGAQANLYGVTVVEGDLWTVGSGSTSGVLWKASTGVFEFLPPWSEGSTTSGFATGMDQAGRTIIGLVDGAPWIWEREGDAWRPTELPTAEGAGYPWALASDPGTGIAHLIAGRQGRPSSGKTSGVYPALWVRNGTSWNEPILLPTSGQGVATGVSEDGLVISGNQEKDDRAAVWTRDPASGVYGRTLLDLPSDYGRSRARGMSPDGALIVGRVWTRKGSNELPAYWERDGSGTWKLHVLPGSTCGRAMAASAVRTIVGETCEHGATLWDLNSGGNAQVLLGLDVNGERPRAHAITRDGAFAVGMAGGNGELLAVFWRLTGGGG